ncbi:MAG: PLP-dependent cysteine synthase family protein [Paracoccus sp. (in: a-proteobacteria)]|nr:PLP-dependent cysteine synthase family protein [Paracoccus sp. (in: a-proteobacteria)]
MNQMHRNSPFVARSDCREWTARAIGLLHADAHRSADTHLINLALPGLPGIEIYLKDESTHPTGSLKHRLARSLFLFGICNGQIRCDTTLIEASSGSTAVSEAYFARLLGLKFIAVMPASTSRQKVDVINRMGGTCHFVDEPCRVYDEAIALAAKTGGHYLDQFTNAERVTDWRGNNNIAESIFRQMENEPHPHPEWIVMGAGTGGTAATIGRYIRYQSLPTSLCVADVENSVFFEAYKDCCRDVTGAVPSRIEGVGRPRVEPSFMPDVIDCMVRVPDAASIAAAHVLSERLLRRVGGSTGTNFMALLWIAARMKAEGRSGSLVTLICDGGERYSDTYYSPDWLAQQGFDIAPHMQKIARFIDTGDGFDDVTLEMSRAY